MELSAGYTNEEGSKVGDSNDSHIKIQKESYVGKWLSIIFSTSFLFEVTLLVIHPLPYFE